MKQKINGLVNGVQFEFNAGLDDYLGNMYYKENFVKISDQSSNLTTALVYLPDFDNEEDQKDKKKFADKTNKTNWKYFIHFDDSESNWARLLQFYKNGDWLGEDPQAEYYSIDEFVDDYIKTVFDNGADFWKKKGDFWGLVRGLDFTYKVVHEYVVYYSQGYSQGDAVYVITKPYADSEHLYIDRLLWDIPYYGTIDINNDQYTITDYLDDVYDVSLEKIVGALLFVAKETGVEKEMKLFINEYQMKFDCNNYC